MALRVLENPLSFTACQTRSVWSHDAVMYCAFLISTRCKIKRFDVYVRNCSHLLKLWDMDNSTNFVCVAVVCLHNLTKDAE
jgi:hypothetical protein